MDSFKTLALAGALLGASAFAASASTVYTNDFSANDTGFTGASVQTAPSGQKFYGILSYGSAATLSLTGLGANVATTVVFDLYALATLDGDHYYWGSDYFTVAINGGTVFDETFSNFVNDPAFSQSYGGTGSLAGNGAYAQDVTGYGNPTDFAYRITLNGMTDANGNLTVAFIGNSNQPWGDEGFGIDNVSVSTVPVPAGLPLLAGGLALLGLARRRKA